MIYLTLDMTYLTLDMIYVTTKMTYLTLDMTYLTLDIYLTLNVHIRCKVFVVFDPENDLKD